jgi:hypothetical protein
MVDESTFRAAVANFASASRSSRSAPPGMRAVRSSLFVDDAVCRRSVPSRDDTDTRPWSCTYSRRYRMRQFLLRVLDLGGLLDWLFGLSTHVPSDQRHKRSAVRLGPCRGKRNLQCVVQPRPTTPYTSVEVGRQMPWSARSASAARLACRRPARNGRLSLTRDHPDGRPATVVGKSRPRWAVGR